MMASEPTRQADAGPQGEISPLRFAGPESFDIVAQSRPETLAGVTSVVCVPTFKRPDMLEATLRSLAAQAGSHDFAVIVVENEGARAGRGDARESPARCRVVQGLRHRRATPGQLQGLQRCLALRADALPALQHVLGIDDDEEAEPGWLAAFLAAAATAPAELFGGSVRPVFADRSRAWLAAHPVFRSHYQTSGPVPMLYSSANYLIRRSVLERLGFPFLDESFDFTGGGDTDFFTRAKAAGFRFWWVQEAAQREAMPQRRSEFGWIAARGLRNGAISAAIQRRQNPGPAGRAKVLAKSLALLAASVPRGVALGLKTRSGTIGLYHAQVALGRLMSEFGIANEQYRKPEKN